MENNIVDADRSSSQIEMDMSQSDTSILDESIVSASENTQHDSLPSTSSNFSDDMLDRENANNCLNYDFDSIGEFCFETDHVALKGNADYQALLEVIVKLEAQRAQAIKNLEKLRDVKEKALADPIGFVERLQRNEDIGIPKLQKIVELPQIDWSKYAVSGSQLAFGKRQLTRLSTKIDSTAQRQYESGKGKSPRSEQKPFKCTQLWTGEEQKRLEELLIEFPPEEVETRRWEKIANAFGNRTPTQVASRVQKYFIKLMKAGCPIPGRMPSTCYLRKPRRQVIRQQPSTFLASQIPPVYMPDADDENSSYDILQSPSDSEEISDEDDIHPKLKNTPEYQELKLLRKVYRKKIKSTGLAQHVNYQCCRCGCKPIIGIRWHCTDCDPDESIDFCADCVDCIHETGSHTIQHRLEPIHSASSTALDRDYMHFFGSDYNYLDPNYMPVTN